MIKNLIIENATQQAINALIEFPLEVLGSYHGLGNLDETWDDNILYFINDALHTNDIRISQSTLELLPETSTSIERYSYQIKLFTPSGFFDLNCIVDRLSKEKFQKGLCIKLKKGNAIETLYWDSYYQ